ncbi:hypothetical protein ACHAWF_005045 [Thalassiosira exigua]
MTMTTATATAAASANNDSPSVEHFTPSWRRPRRRNDVALGAAPPDSDADADVDGSSDGPSSPDPFWWRCPCLVCGEAPPARTGATPAGPSAEPSRHKRCTRCRSAVYCSKACQKQDYGEGKHKANCVALGELWEEKKKIEGRLWESKTKSTNPFDDEVFKYPVVGSFWHDRPESKLEKNTSNYCVVLLQLVQLLGRGESWRVSRIQQCDVGQSFRRGPGNPLSRELAIDLAYQLLHLDRADMRVRLLIPSLLLEGGYCQEAYDFLKHWLNVDASLKIMDLALMGGSEGGGEGDDNLADFAHGGDIAEPISWLDGEMVYPSIGMVFELAFMKCHLLCSLRRGQIQLGDSNDESPCTFASFQHVELVALSEKLEAAGEEELERQVGLLLSLVHKWNPHLLPNLSGSYNVKTGASAHGNGAVPKGAIVPATPPALSTLLNKHPPGFELQYKMGNPGGMSIDEAVSIWQRDMILWHVVDPMTMKFLSEFCSNLEQNLVDTSCLTGIDESKNAQSNGIDTNISGIDTNAENLLRRKEAEALVTKLQLENPDKNIDEIMMHPDMAQLMIKHLHTG